MKNITKGKYIPLNPPNSADSGLLRTSYSVDFTECEDGKSKADIRRAVQWADISLDVWDCGRKVSLNFDSGSLSELRQRRTKLAKMRVALDIMEGYLDTQEALLREHT